MGRLFHYFEIGAKNSVAQKLHCTISLHGNGNLPRTQIRVPPSNFHFGCSSHKNVSSGAFLCDFGVTQNSECPRNFHFGASGGSHKNVTVCVSHFSRTLMSHEIISKRQEISLREQE